MSEQAFQSASESGQLQWELPVVPGGQVHLTELRPTDKPALVRWLNDRDIYDRTLRIPYPYREADADAFLRIIEESTAKHGHPTNFAIRDSAGELIGGCGFDGLIYRHKAELGYWLAKPYWGQGLMTAVVGALCAFALAEWRLVRIIAHVFDFNEASSRVLEKNGFVLEGTLRKHLCKEGQYITTKLYALVI